MRLGHFSPTLVVFCNGPPVPEVCLLSEGGVERRGRDV